MGTQTFKGHGIVAMFINVIAAFFPVFLLLFARQQPVSEINHFYYPLVLEALWFLPLPCYLFFEAKLLIRKAGIAEDKSLISFFVFGGQSLLGLILQVTTLVLAIKLNLFGPPTFALVMTLSVLASFGACLGLTDFHILFVFLPHKAIQDCLIFFKSWRLVLVCVSTTALLSLLTSLFVSL